MTVTASPDHNCIKRFIGTKSPLLQVVVVSRTSGGTAIVDYTESCGADDDPLLQNQNKRFFLLTFLPYELKLPRKFVSDSRARTKDCYSLGLSVGRFPRSRRLNVDEGPCGPNGFRRRYQPFHGHIALPCRRGSASHKRHRCWRKTEAACLVASTTGTLLRTLFAGGEYVGSDRVGCWVARAAFIWTSLAKSADSVTNGGDTQNLLRMMLSCAAFSERSPSGGRHAI